MEKIRVKLGSVVLLGAMTTIACGQGIGLVAHQQRTQAPQSSEDVGFIVDEVSEKELTQLMSENPKAQFRSIYPPRGMYEVFGIPQAEIQNVLGEKMIVKNDFFEIQLNEATESPSEKLKRYSTMASEANTSDSAFSACVEDLESPTAKITKVGLAKDILEAGGKFSLNGKTSVPSAKNPSVLKYAWIYSPPEDSNFSEGVSFGPEAEFKTDAYGLYQVILVVQDARKVCHMDSVLITATGNKSFRGPQSSDSSFLNQIRLQDFPHLQQLKQQEAWKKSEGKGLKIAILDTGVDFNHPALAQNILVNKGEVPDNGIDDDGNGFIDDVVGYDFANADGSPFDDGGHGTHVAGLAASSVFGTARKAQILSVKVLGPMSGDVASIAGGIYYALDRGADILNMSLGTYGTPHPTMVKAIDLAEEKGVLIVAASGNGHPLTGKGLDTDRVPNFPSSFPHKNIVSVASRGTTTPLAFYSNFGANTVDLAAPGGTGPEDGLNSTFTENPKRVLFKKFSGTSMASPVVAGIAAQILSINPELKPNQVRELLLKSGELSASLKGKVVSSRFLDSLSAVQLAEQSQTLPLMH